MSNILNPYYWQVQRTLYMQAARSCKKALTEKRRYELEMVSYIFGPEYPPNAPQVRDAVKSWVDKARNAHAFAMGRKPIIESILIITN